jgi:hypothetical protein
MQTRIAPHQIAGTKEKARFICDLVNQSPLFRELRSAFRLNGPYYFKDGSYVEHPPNGQTKRNAKWRLIADIPEDDTSDQIFMGLMPQLKAFMWGADLAWDEVHRRVAHTLDEALNSGKGIYKP